MNRGFLEKWICEDEKAEVALVCAPVTFPPVPSIALSLFKAVLNEAGISSRVIYSMFPTNHLLGVNSIYEADPFVALKGNGEYLFAHLTDAAAAVSMQRYADLHYAHLEPDVRSKVLAFMEHGKKVAEMIVDAIAERIIRMGARIVAVSSIYSQQNASLAVLKRVKELDPTIATLMGGYNVSGEMGLAILRNYPSVDYISFGEGDETIAEVCEILLGKRNGPMPYGILGQHDPVPETIPYRMTRDLNLMPVPDYSDFFEEIHREADGYYGDIPVYYGETYENVIFLEGSRGCWWGAKHACTFCGLNGLNNVYREKTPERLYEEIRESVRRYPGVNIQLADNVLSQNMIRKLPPLLTADEEQYSILAEIKTNLKPEEVHSLAKAGITLTQPGIESLNDHLLKLMGKGSTAVQNVALLKYARGAGMTTVWNLMIGVPGEKREDFEQMLELIPLISHLYPPTWASPIVFTRFSGYTNDPEAYGLELKPDLLYECCYDGNEDLIQNMGVYYALAGGPFKDVVRNNRDLYRKIDQAVKEWRKLSFSEKHPALIMSETIFGISIYDTRPVAVQAKTLLVGLAARVYRLAYEPVRWETLCKELPDISEERLKSCLNDLVERRIMICLSGRYLALAVRFA